MYYIEITLTLIINHIAHSSTKIQFISIFLLSYYTLLLVL